MFSWLKKHFIPHPENDHRPHILRDQSTRNIIAIILFLELFSFVLPTVSNINMLDGMAAVLPSVLSDLTNVERQSQRLPILSVNSLLNKAAEMKAQDMALKGYFAHTSPEGLTPWYWILLSGYKYQYAGENLAVNFQDSKDVTEAWLNSPTHKANIVKGNYTEMGTGIANGMYKGREAVFVAQVYANPMPKTFPKAVVVETKPSPTPKIVAVSEPTKETENVLGAEVSTTASLAVNPDVQILNIENKNYTETQPTFWQKLLASPRNTTNVLMAIIFSIVALALLLYIIIKIRSHHVDLLTNGLAMLAIIGAIFIANYQYSYRSMVITQGLDYSVESK
ncbi:MAG: CAP domain-containing protein [Minisyncoccia bacterium]